MWTNKKFITTGQKIIILNVSFLCKNHILRNSYFFFFLPKPTNWIFGGVTHRTRQSEAERFRLRRILAAMKVKLLVLVLLTGAILIFQTGYQSLHTQLKNTFERGRDLCNHTLLTFFSYNNTDPSLPCRSSLGWKECVTSHKNLGLVKLRLESFIDS